MATLKVWLSPYNSTRPADLIGMDQDQLAREVAFTTFDMPAGYTVVGTAEVQINLTPHAELVQAQVAAMEQQITEAGAAYQARVTELRRQIQQLLCIEAS